MKKSTLLIFLFLAYLTQGYAQTEPTDEDLSGSSSLIRAKPPRFPGGSDKLRRFVQKKFRYPQLLARLGIEGKVLVRFNVNYEGNIDLITILESGGQGFDKQGMRIIGLMPRWQPSESNGVPRTVRFTLPITFKLEKPRRRRKDTTNTRDKLFYLNGTCIGTVRENEALIQGLSLKKRPFKLKEDAKAVYLTLPK